MQAYRFVVGETVLYAERRFPNLKWKAPFRILGLMPLKNGEPQYLVQSADLTYDRIASEYQLSRQPVSKEACRRLDGRSLASSRLDRRGSPASRVPSVTQHRGRSTGAIEISAEAAR